MTRSDSDALLPMQGTNVVVTGASSGIGRSIAIDLAAAGAARVLVHYRTNETGARETADIVQSAGADALCLSADFGQDDDIDRFAQEAFQRLGYVDAWVNNAGVDVLTGDAAQWSFQQKLERLLRVEVVGTARLSRHVVDRWQKQAGDTPPSLTFISWDQAIEGMEMDAGQMFGPVKAAVRAFANSLAQQVAPTIRVNTVAPGWIRTSWGDSTSEYWDRRAREQSLMQRWGTPQDVADAVRYLATARHTFVTGQTINVNGGFSRRFE
ncbi:SDR family NAD(P)-dependent oxidoreductase [Crateriforma conspicua]|uniref:SDR family NAD(P)-dependent oxidoreductase n=1 Tax=Crateriforma conspicua TaxID=2527996 RepID=UPI00118C3A38|nr:SDR family oxidoreductase [Crateriforma conspicua]QDV63841.1 3-oxoacyl-[acyl-carrier-protein] reductase FabG [Crateriforma conspicua]